VIAARYGVHPTQVSTSRKEIAGWLPELFGKKGGPDAKEEAAREDQLCRKIGQLEMQIDWAKKQFQEPGL
jgi:transposase